MARLNCVSQGKGHPQGQQQVASQGQQSVTVPLASDAGGQLPISETATPALKLTTESRRTRGLSEKLCDLRVSVVRFSCIGRSQRAFQRGVACLQQHRNPMLSARVERLIL